MNFVLLSRNGSVDAVVVVVVTAVVDVKVVLVDAVVVTVVIAVVDVELISVEVSESSWHFLVSPSTRNRIKK